MTENETMRIAEQAYRRGVHQAFAMLGYFLDENPDISARNVVKKAEEIAKNTRTSKQKHPFLLHKLFEKMEKKNP